MGKPVTVKLTSQSTAMREINDAIKKVLKANGSALNQQARVDLQTQATASTDATALQLISNQLNGPVSGYQIPTEFELYVPLRALMQQTGSFPCANDPFNNEAYDPNANLKYLTSSPPSSPPVDPQFNYVIQRLQYLSLHDRFVSDLSGYQNYTDLYLEDEALADLEKRIVTDIDSYLTVTDMQQWLTTAWQTQQASGMNTSPVTTGSKASGAAAAGSPPSSPPAPLLINPPISQALYLQVRTWLGVMNNETAIDEITSHYISELTGPNSTVFPPATGKTFLENLSALLYGNIKSLLTSTLVAGTIVEVPISSNLAQILATSPTTSKTTVVNTLPILQEGIDITLFQQLVGVGLQGMLLADIYDYEKSLDFQQSTMTMLNSLPQYTAFTATANNDATNMAQAILGAQTALDTYYGLWQTANLAVNQNAAISGGGSSNINSRLASSFNGTGSPPMEQYLLYLVGGSNGQMDTAEDYSTNISVQLAGLNYIAQTAMVAQPTQDNVNNFVQTIATQVQSDITQIQAAFTSYASSTANYLSNEELYAANNDVLLAQTGVSGDVNSIMNSAQLAKAY